jgi:hypothetical protein
MILLDLMIDAGRGLKRAPGAARKAGVQPTKP